MTIDNLKMLQKLITLCRKTGVSAIKIDNIELQLGLEPIKTSINDRLQSFVAPEANISVPIYNGGQYTGQSALVQDKIDTSELTDEQLLYYSSRPEAPGEQ